MSPRKQRYTDTCFNPASQLGGEQHFQEPWRHHTSWCGGGGISHTSGSDASRDTSGFTVVVTPRSAEGCRTLRSFTVADGAGLSRNSMESSLSDLHPDTARVDYEAGRERITASTKNYRLKRTQLARWVRRAEPCSFHPIKSSLFLLSRPILVAPLQILSLIGKCHPLTDISLCLTETLSLFVS